MAEGSGSRLGSLVSISTSEFGYVPWLAASAESVKAADSGAAVATSINPKSLKKNRISQHSFLVMDYNDTKSLNPLVFLVFNGGILI